MSMTPHQVAVTLGVSDKYVRALLRAGRLKGEQSDGVHWTVPSVEVDRFQAERSGSVHLGVPRRQDAAPEETTATEVAEAGRRGKQYGHVGLESLGFSVWHVFPRDVQSAPRSPGVYVLRDAEERIIYVGMAGLRNGAGIYGRLMRYVSGKAAASGFGEVALDRALADAAWVEARYLETRAGRPRRVTEWSKLAIARLDASVCWAPTASSEAARRLESSLLGAEIFDETWNRRRS